MPEIQDNNKIVHYWSYRLAVKWKCTAKLITLRSMFFSPVCVCFEWGNQTCSVCVSTHTSLCDSGLVINFPVSPIPHGLGLWLSQWRRGEGSGWRSSYPKAPTRNILRVRDTHTWEHMCTQSHTVVVKVSAKLVTFVIKIRLSLKS